MRKFTDADLLACHRAGMTAPEAARKLAVCVSTIYRRANDLGIRMHSRKGPLPPDRFNEVMRRHEATRLAAHQAAMERRRRTPVNGWTWRQLAEAGFTAPEAARARGMTTAAAYAAARSGGFAFVSHHKDPRRQPRAGLTDTERVDYDRWAKMGYSRAERLRILGREDLIEGFEPGDPLEVLRNRMARDAAACNARIRAANEALGAAQEARVAAPGHQPSRDATCPPVRRSGGCRAVSASENREAVE